MDLKNARILIVDDDQIVARTLERSLRAGGFQVSVSHNGVEALQAARSNRPDLVVLDVMMPGMDGYEVCRQIRNDQLLEDLPVLFLSAKGKEEERITGFRVGADDYLSKPFNLDELYLRVRAILRRAMRQKEETKERTTTLQAGGHTLHVRSFQVTGPRGKINLTSVQFDLLYHLMSHAGEVFSPNRLLQEVWGYPHDAGSPDLVRVHVKNLRTKIEEDPSTPTFIQTVKGHGYVVMPSELVEV